MLIQRYHGLTENVQQIQGYCYISVMIDIPDTGKGTSVIRLTPARCNIWVVSRNGRSIVVDTGISFDRSRIANALERKGLIPEAVVLTHTHFDHAGNAAWLQAEYGAEVVVQEDESAMLAAGEMPIPGGTYTFTRGLVSIGRKIEQVFRYDPCIADNVFIDHFDLNRFGINGFIIHTPGHSPGGATVVIDGEIALAGDSVIGTMPGSPFPPFADDVKVLIGTWKKIIDTGCRIILPGHGKPVSREEMISEYNRRGTG